MELDSEVSNLPVWAVNEFRQRIERGERVAFIGRSTVAGKRFLADLGKLWSDQWHFEWDEALSRLRCLETGAEIYLFVQFYLFTLQGHECHAAFVQKGCALTQDEYDMLFTRVRMVPRYGDAVIQL